MKDQRSGINSQEAEDFIALELDKVSHITKANTALL